MNKLFVKCYVDQLWSSPVTPSKDVIQSFQSYYPSYYMIFENLKKKAWYRFGALGVYLSYTPDFYLVLILVLISIYYKEVASLMRVENSTICLRSNLIIILN